MTSSRSSAPSSDDLEIGDVRFVTRGVSPTDQAIVLAVLGTLLREESAEARATPRIAPDAWSRTQRGLRSPLTPGAGAWRSFSG